MSDLSLTTESAVHSRTDAAITWIKGRERLVLALAVAVQLAVLVGMIVLRSLPYATGQTVLVQVVPVDPRDFFRGDYVVLSYEFSRLPAGGLPGLRAPHGYDANERRDIYVALQPDADGRHYRMGQFSLTPPTTDKYLRGTLIGGWRIEYGIENFFVQEGHGRQYEEAVRSRRLWAEVAIGSDGQGALKRLEIENTPNGIPAKAIAP